MMALQVEADGASRTAEQPTPVTFIMPAYNCSQTVSESVESIFDGNFCPGDEVIIVNDASTDDTRRVLHDLQHRFPAIQVIEHQRNKGGGAARNTAVECARNTLIFCLDSDNILVPGSVPDLREYLAITGADVAAFQETRYFRTDPATVTHMWVFPEMVTLADCLAGSRTPGASGNYLYTKESWLRAGGYPEFASALDTWGFGFRQLATGARMLCMPRSYYLHRYGHESYWVRFERSQSVSLIALQILLPYLHLIDEADADRILSRPFRDTWFSQLSDRPVRLKGVSTGRAGKVVHLMLPKPIGDRAVTRIRRKVKQLLLGLW
jgi:glycosyltransferase involved in cell wall biosynthesis